jgi:hypothetical protein
MKHVDTVDCKCADCQVSWLDFLQPRPNPFLSGIKIVRKDTVPVNPKSYEALYKVMGCNQRYYLTEDGHRLTDGMTVADIQAKFKKTVKELEAAGFRVIPA